MKELKKQELSDKLFESEFENVKQDLDIVDSSDLELTKTTLKPCGTTIKDQNSVKILVEKSKKKNLIECSIKKEKL